MGRSERRTRWLRGKWLGVFKEQKFSALNFEQFAFLQQNCQDFQENALLVWVIHLMEIQKKGLARYENWDHRGVTWQNRELRAMGDSQTPKAPKEFKDVLGKTLGFSESMNSRSGSSKVTQLTSEFCMFVCAEFYLSRLWCYLDFIFVLFLQTVMLPRLHLKHIPSKYISS